MSVPPIKKGTGIVRRIWPLRLGRLPQKLPGQKVAQLLKSISGQARAGSVADAGPFGEVLELATPWPATQQDISSAGNLAGKTVIECTNPLASDLSGLVIGTQNFAGDEVSRWAV
jgi:predicted dinucleotide-binding enzyme